jgi:glycosyltransferase involved in cell wall biosynthesis
MRVEITVPAYNEAQIIGERLASLRAFLMDAPFDYHVTIADNGSTDGTAVIAQRACLSDPHMSVFHTARKGRGNALRAVWSQSHADLLVYMDADLSTALRHLPELVALLEGGADVVSGNRLCAAAQVKRRLYRTALSVAYNALAQRMIGLSVTDLQCGFKGIRREAFGILSPHCGSDGWFFDSELMAWAEKKRMRIVQIPITWVERTASKVSVVPAVGEYLAQLRGLRSELKAVRLL